MRAPIPHAPSSGDDNSINSNDDADDVFSLNLKILKKTTVTVNKTILTFLSESCPKHHKTFATQWQESNALQLGSSESTDLLFCFLSVLSRLLSSKAQNQVAVKVMSTVPGHK